MTDRDLDRQQNVALAVTLIFLTLVFGVIGYEALRGWLTNV